MHWEHDDTWGCGRAGGGGGGVVTWREVGLRLLLLLQLVIAVQTLQVPYPEGSHPPATAVTHPTIAVPSQYLCCCRRIAHEHNTQLVSCMQAVITQSTLLGMASSGTGRQRRTRSEVDGRLPGTTMAKKLRLSGVIEDKLIMEGTINSTKLHSTPMAKLQHCMAELRCYCCESPF